LVIRRVEIPGLGFMHLQRVTYLTIRRPECDESRSYFCLFLCLE